ncbi:MAG TPA: thioredoxin [Blastocatellia bacterium]
MSARSEPELISCPACGAKNRIAPDKVSPGRVPVCARCKTPLTASTHPITITDANFAAEVERSPIPVLVDFWAVWCGPCRVVAPVVEQLAGELAGKVKVGKLNVDENQATASRFGIASIPTLLIMKDGKVAGRIVGAQSKAAIIAKLRSVM